MQKSAVGVCAFVLATSLGVTAFAQPYMPFAATVAPPPPTVITVFDQPNYKGRKMVFDRMVPSLAKLQFNDVIASVQIQGTRDWVLCEHRNFMGKCVRIRAKEKDLKRLKINGQVSSLYPVPPAPPPVKKN
jgi:hypothetical protein